MKVTTKRIAFVGAFIAAIALPAFASYASANPSTTKIATAQASPMPSMAPSASPSPSST